jgi:TRAP-type transport system periplasmic protein
MKNSDCAKRSCSWFLCFMALLLISLAFTWAEAKAANTGTIRIAHTSTETDLFDPYKSLTSTFKFVVEQETRGRFKVQSYPNSQLGGVMPTLQQCERGLLEMTTGQNTAFLSSWYPEIQVLDIPYLFPSLEVARKVLDGPFGQYLSDKMAEKCGIRVLAWMPSAMRNFATNKEIRTPKDLKGMKMRVMETPVYIQMLKSMGAIPTPIPWTELYTASATNVIDGQDQPPYIMRTAKFYEVNKYYLLDQHSLNSMALFMSNSFYKGLSADDQRIVRYAAREARTAMLGVITTTLGSDLTWLADEGKMKIHLSTADERQQFKKEASDPVVSWLRTQIDPKTIDMLKKAIADAEKELK